MYYHITSSKYDFGETKIFSPRIPLIRYVNDNGVDIEDSITPRVCLCPTIFGCFIAKEFSSLFILKNNKRSYKNVVVDKKELNFNWNSLIIFATPSIPNMFKPKHYVKHPDKHNTGIVPDSFVSGEVWSLDPIELTVIANYDDLFPKVRKLLMQQYIKEYNRYIKYDLIKLS